MLNEVDKLFLEVTSMSEGKYIRLDEETKAKMQDKIVSSVFKSIKKKALSLDFTVVDKSRGKFNNLANYNDITNSIKFLKKILVENATKNKAKEMEEAVNCLELAVEMLVKYEKYFTKGYDANASMLKFLYEGTCVGVIQLTSYLISDCLSYVDAGAVVEVKANPSKNIAKLNIYNALKNIVNIYRNNKMEKYLKECISINEGTVTINVLQWLGYAFIMLISLRAFIYAYFMTRVKISEYLNQLADFVELNASTVSNEKVKEKQTKWVERLRKVANKVKVDLEVSSARAEEEINEENEEINNTMPSDDLGLA